MGSDAAKGKLSLAKAIAQGVLTASEVNTVNQVWAKWDGDFASLTTGKKKIKAAAAIAIIGPRKSIPEIIGHALSAPVKGDTPADSASMAPGGGTGLPLLPIICGLVLLGGVAFMFMKKKAA